MATEANALSSAVPLLESPLPREVLSSLYAAMLKARLLSKRLRTASFAEAVVAGALQDTDADDVVVSATADPVLEVLRGAELSSVIGPKLAAKSKTDHAPVVSNIVVAGSMASAGIAAGLAFALKRQQSSSLVLAFLPGNLTRGPAWEQATEFAATHRLPIIFIADWTDSRNSRPHDGPALSHWPFPTISVDGRDVIAVFRVTKEAISAARRGHGPTLVDGINFLAPGKRGRDERDPVDSFRGYLKRHNAWSEEWASDLESQLNQEIGVPTAKGKRRK
jgi:TPP-dependent pyruvate/acetoin dehydrogenase alpha subunit